MLTERLYPRCAMMSWHARRAGATIPLAGRLLKKCPAGQGFSGDIVATQLNARPATGSKSWRQTFRAFRHYNYRLYFFGLLVSVIGSFGQTVAQGWLVYELTNSPLALGQVTFVAAIPVLMFGPWAGVVIDRTSRRTLLMITQAVQMLQAFTLAALTFTGHIQVWHIMILSGVLGLTNAFDAPARQSIVVELAGKEDLSNAIALNSTLFSLARAVGPAIGGLVVAGLGTAWAFTINGISFLAILISLLSMRLEKTILQPSSRSPLADLAEGLRFVWHQKTIMALMVIAMTVGLFGANFITLMPAVARDILGRDEVALGMLSGAAGVGSVAGALVVAYLSGQPGRGRHLNLINLLFPLSLFAFSFSRSYPLSLLILVAVGTGYTPQLSLCNMLIQTNTPDHLRGRVMSVYTLLIFGSFPLGGLIAGSVADRWDVPTALAASAGAVLLIGLLLRVLVPQLKEME